MLDDIYYMEQAMELAKIHLGFTSPNPCVGAIVVKDDQIVGRGSHPRAGDNHAEVIAIKQAQHLAHNATLYVTLEPCSHSAKTPACTDFIISNKIARVVVATFDPNPLVNGRGIRQLEDAGIEVINGVLADKAKKLNQYFFHYITTKTPFITLKCGMSLDAKLATKNFQSKWITNSISRSDAHNYRNTHDAIMVGVNTIIRDDPSLTTRLVNGRSKNPIRIVLDTSLRTPLKAKIIIDGKGPTWIIVGCDVLPQKIKLYEDVGVKIIVMPTSEIDLYQVMSMLGQKEVTSILVEGGSKVIDSLIRHNLFNQIILYIAPILLGSHSIPALVADFGVDSLDEAMRFKIDQVCTLGGDLKVILSKGDGLCSQVL